MPKKEIALEQISEHNHTPREFSAKEVGDEVGNYRVVDVSEVRCDHPEYRYHLTSGKPRDERTVKRTCKICGEEDEAPLEEVFEE